MKYDFIIYGAGFAGLSLAISLRKSCENILILEPCDKNLYDSITKKDTRTTALSYNSKSFYDSHGVWNNLYKYSGNIEDIRILDSDFKGGDSPLKLDFASEDVGDEPMGYIIENSDFRTELLRTVESYDNVEIKYSSIISGFENLDDSIEVTLDDGQKFSALLLMATDGRNSKLRDLSTIRTIDKDYEQSALTFNIWHEKSHNCLALEKFMPTGPFAVLPMKDDNKSSIVWTVKRHLANHYLKMSESDFMDEVKLRLGEYLGEDVKLISQRLSFPLNLRYTKRYYERRLVLIGDTAHGMHPIAGQGFNQGVKDIQKLEKLISERFSLGLPIYSEKMLNDYESSAFAENVQMLLATDIFNSLFSNDNSILKIGRRLGISAVDKAHKVKSFFIKRAMGA